MFGNKFRDGKVFADWVTDSLVLSNGKLLQYVHLGYASVYEKTTLISVSSGQIIAIRDFKNVIHDPTRLSRFDYPRWHDTVFSLLDQRIRWNKLPQDEDDWWFEDIELTITQKGDTKIKIPDYLDKKYLKEVRRVLKNLKWKLRNGLVSPTNSI